MRRLLSSSFHLPHKKSLGIFLKFEGISSSFESTEKSDWLGCIHESTLMTFVSVAAFEERIFSGTHCACKCETSHANLDR